MQSVLQILDQALRQAIRTAVGFDSDPILGPSQNEKFGDYQSNAAMGLAKTVAEKTGQKTNPRAIAEQIKAKLDLGTIASDISIAGPGFINIRLNPAWLGQFLQSISSDSRLGVAATEKPETVVVDYSSPNIAKQMHVGHLRSTIIGDTISRVIEFQGHRVIRQNHLGDWGTQFGMLIARLKERQATGNAQIEDLDGFYKEARQRFDSDPAFADAARANVVRLQGGGSDEKSLWLGIVDATRKHYQPIYDRLGVKLNQDNERGESFYNAMLPGVVADLKRAGIAAESEGAVVVFTDGFDAPIIIEKTGGGYGYATTDLAAIRYRIEQLKAQRLIYVVGNTQSQHFQQVFATARKASWSKDATLQFAGFGSVLGDDGKMFKARSGASVKLSDLLDEAEVRALKVVEQKNPELPEDHRRAIAKAVGMGAIKYADLSKDRVGDYVFNWDTMLALDGNTAPYLQYVYARIRSIFRKAQGQGARGEGQGILLESPFELALAKHVLRIGEIIELVARELKPHYLCTYLYDLASKFGGFYENCPVLKSEEPARSSRLTLCDLTARTMALGLDLLGIEHPEQM